MTSHLSRSAALFVVVSVCVTVGDRRMTASADDIKVTPGELVVDHPTLINLGFEWLIDGDANRNAQVAVSYRKPGDT